MRAFLGVVIALGAARALAARWWLVVGLVGGVLLLSLWLTRPTSHKAKPYCLGPNAPLHHPASCQYDALVWAYAHGDCTDGPLTKGPDGEPEPGLPICK